MIDTSAVTPIVRSVEVGELDPVIRITLSPMAMTKLSASKKKPIVAKQS